MPTATPRVPTPDAVTLLAACVRAGGPNAVAAAIRVLRQEIARLAGRSSPDERGGERELIRQPLHPRVGAVRVPHRERPAGAGGHDDPATTHGDAGAGRRVGRVAGQEAAAVGEGRRVEHPHQRAAAGAGGGHQFRPAVAVEVAPRKGNAAAESRAVGEGDGPLAARPTVEHLDHRPAADTGPGRHAVTDGSHGHAGSQPGIEGIEVERRSAVDAEHPHPRGTALPRPDHDLGQPVAVGVAGRQIDRTG